MKYLAIIIFLGFFSLGAYSLIKKEKSVSAVKDIQFGERVLSEDANQAGHLPKKPKGGIVPHHSLAVDMTDGFFEEIGVSDEIRTVILIGPNHFEQGENIVSCLDDCREIFGSEINEELAFLLGGVGKISFREEIIKKEHSIISLVPFVKKSFPQASILPVILRKNVGVEDLEKFSNIIAGYMEENEGIVISSVDFSHYLNSSDSEKMDSESINAIKEKEYGQLKKFGSEHMDSPESVILLMLTMEKLGRKNFEVIGHTNSGYLLNDKFSPVTSYYSLIF